MRLLWLFTRLVHYSVPEANRLKLGEHRPLGVKVEVVSVAGCPDVGHVDEAAALAQLLDQLVLFRSKSIVLAGHNDCLWQLLNQVNLPHALLSAVDGKCVGVVECAELCFFLRLQQVKSLLAATNPTDTSLNAPGRRERLQRLADHILLLKEHPDALGRRHGQRTLVRDRVLLRSRHLASTLRV